MAAEPQDVVRYGEPGVPKEARWVREGNALVLRDTKTGHIVAWDYAPTYDDGP